MKLEKMRPNNHRENEVVDIIVVGAGPVGLTASLLLSRYRIHHLVIEQRLEPTGHPQVHFISCRSMEIFRELKLDHTIRRLSAPLDDRFFTLRKIYLSDDKDRSEDEIFTFAEDFPSFFPTRFAALVRPDAHVAGFESAGSLD